MKQGKTAEKTGERKMKELHSTKHAVITGSIFAPGIVKCVETARDCSRMRTWFVYSDSIGTGESWKCRYKQMPAKAVTAARKLLADVQ